MHGGAGAGGGDRHLARILLGIGDEVAEGLQRRVGVDRERKAVTTETRDPGEVLDGIPIDLLHIRIAQQSRGGCRDRVPVRLFVFCHGGGRERGACARLVLDDDRLPELSGCELAELPEGDVGGAACRESNEQSDGSDRIVFLRHGELAGRRKQCGSKHSVTQRSLK